MSRYRIMVLAIAVGAFLVLGALVGAMLQELLGLDPLTGYLAVLAMWLVIHQSSDTRR